jgi:hypothetical protein
LNAQIQWNFKHFTYKGGGQKLGGQSLIFTQNGFAVISNKKKWMLVIWDETIYIRCKKILNKYIKKKIWKKEDNMD